MKLWRNTSKFNFQRRIPTSAFRVRLMHVIDGSREKKKKDKNMLLKSRKSCFLRDLLTCSSILSVHPSSDMQSRTPVWLRVVLPGCRCEGEPEQRVMRSIQTSSADCLSDTLSSFSLLLFLSLSLSLSLSLFPPTRFYTPTLLSQSVLLTFLRLI